MRLLLMLALPLLSAAQSYVPAFPGAEGFGAGTPGGRGGRVLYVTNLNDAGPGSLRAAVDTPGARVILFQVGGRIELKSPIRVRRPQVTIAGQTAPGDGICLAHYPLSIETSDVIVRYLRVRLGDESGYEGDAVSIGSPSRNVILDHVSASWSIDEALSASGNIANVTVQWSLISESLTNSIHAKGTHGYGSLLRAVGGVSYHHNLWAHHNGRNPRLGDNYGEGDEPTYDIRNNVIYNWGGYGTGVIDGRISVNYLGNYFRGGPNSRLTRAFYMGDAAGDFTRFFLWGNVVEQRPEVESNNALLFDRTQMNGRPLVTIAPSVFAMPEYSLDWARAAMERVLEGAGATLPRRDAVDTRVVETVRNRAGRLIDSQNEVGGWPEYRGGVAPLDTDGDGLPDDWERERGLNPDDPATGALRLPSGYTILDLYLDELTRR